MLEERKVEDGVIYATDRGQVLLRIPLPGVVLATYEGVAAEAFVPKITATLDQWIADGRRVTIGVDTLELSSYETGYRKGWTQWMGDNRPHIQGVHILFRSRLVQMGITIVNSLIGGVITAYTDRAKFDTAVALAVHGQEQASAAPPK